MSTSDLFGFVEQSLGLIRGASLFYVSQMCLVRLVLENLWWVLLVLTCWQTTVWAVNHVWNFSRVYMGGKLRALGMPIDAVVMALNSL